MSNPKELKYTQEHEWLRIEGNTGTVGITDHAQEALGEVTFVELPDEGRETSPGDEVGAIESSKAASSIYAPAAGKIAEVNTALDEDPSPVNSDPYGQGWIYKIELSEPHQADGLMDADAYENFLKEEE